ncbi:hypothetical protein DICPUDRAFT_152575 [Dictyostelium purpureum]|uniref:Uncharacterized protein n=1 Tax=Dictyostelium purpureum TaxID=5786 RepID=F0ZLQ8_DICPU|nr:uncharacterized protein DICPUDRAFT_152575 [Dictyostelium purpureum]EGC35100.1 hypothetical protein DICPUDRAFT_152575 [Dictyostelium purpureum]|eukprot:XP_003288352.1 hypothetical protein DICPUDRAFT_152575 [Dictyostelium purpureum]
MNAKVIVALILSIILWVALVITPWYWFRDGDDYANFYKYNGFSFNGNFYKFTEFQKGIYKNQIQIFSASLAFAVLALVVVTIFALLVILQLAGILSKFPGASLAKFIPIISLIFCLLSMFIFCGVTEARKRDCKIYPSSFMCADKVKNNFMGSYNGLTWGGSVGFVFISKNNIEYNEELYELEDLLQKDLNFESVLNNANIYSEGYIEAPLSININEIGYMSFPCYSEQLKEVISRFGQEETTNIGKIWKITPNNFKIDSKTWSSVFTQISNNVVKALGIPNSNNQRIEFVNEKLLILESGSFFLPHKKDNNSNSNYNDDAQFAQLFLILPTNSKGGDLKIIYNSNTTIVPLENNTGSTIKFVSFYNDCIVESEPITEGYRVALVYSVIDKLHNNTNNNSGMMDTNEDSNQQPAIVSNISVKSLEQNKLDYQVNIQSIAKELNKMYSREKGLKFIYILENTYDYGVGNPITANELCDGHDRLVAEKLRSITQLYDYNVYLATLDIMRESTTSSTSDNTMNSECNDEYELKLVNLLDLETNIFWSEMELSALENFEELLPVESLYSREYYKRTVPRKENDTIIQKFYYTLTSLVIFKKSEKSNIIEKFCTKYDLKQKELERLK